MDSVYTYLLANYRNLLPAETEPAASYGCYLNPLVESFLWAGVIPLKNEPPAIYPTRDEQNNYYLPMGDNLYGE